LLLSSITGELFAAPALQAAFLKARAAADSHDIPLRLRLFVGPSAPELHTLRWENCATRPKTGRC
jgi:hypothetical protein